MTQENGQSAKTSTPEERTLPYWELLFREIIGIQALAVVLVCVALIWNAPLEQLADPLHTPNPAKAPWYFTGLQELLHYFPPLVAGVLLPALIVLALVVIPFFEVNIKGESLWAKNRNKRLAIVLIVTLVLSVTLIRFQAWDPLIPVWVIALCCIVAATSTGVTSGFRAWLHFKPLSFWLMTWFLMEAITLTTVGSLFRGPGWEFVLPWGAN